MIDKNELMHTLTKEYQDLKEKVKNRESYNKKMKKYRNLLKLGIKLNLWFPYIISTIYFTHQFQKEGNLPFIFDQIKEYANVKTIDTSNNRHLEYVSYDENYDDELIQYSTKWVKDDNDLFTRNIITYRIDNNLDLNDTKKILSMSKDELESLVIITNVETIKKDKLDNDDIMFNENIIYITNHKKSKEFITRKENIGENIAISICYLICIIDVGAIASVAYQKLTNNKLENYLKNKEYSCKNTDVNEINELRQLLKIKEENLKLLDENRQIDNKEQQFYLRKKV